VTTFESIAPRLAEQAIELPSWAFGNSGTRFKVFGTPGTPRTPQEKIADAAQVNQYTGLSPTVALHIPWDKVDDYAALGAFAHDHGVALGTINSNTFQDDDYKFGSLTHVDKKVRQKAIDHHFECIDIMSATGSRDLKIWLADGTNYPGQGDVRGRQDRLAESLATMYSSTSSSSRRSTTPTFPTGVPATRR
jgi:L-rhamnose isomerase/sugar isomerase